MIIVVFMAVGLSIVAEAQSLPRQVLWGDTHLHTNYSFDAAVLGNRQLTPADAYRLARGDVVTAHNGQKVKLKKPLDFLVVADHAEYLGLIPMLLKGDPLLLKDKVGRRWADILADNESLDGLQKLFFEIGNDKAKGIQRLKNEAVSGSAWHDITSTADIYNQPQVFTSFSGYEWTSAPGGNNLHRVVIFADDANKANQLLPFSAYDSEDPEALWKHLERYQQLTGGRALAIAHNGNVSNGAMFSLTDFSGRPLSESYARSRQRWEPLYEVTQIKGDSETHQKLSPADEFSDFEFWDKGNLNASAQIEPHMLEGNYARSALKRGLQQEAVLGVNPFKFGMIGSTDAHTSLATADEDNFWGKMSAYEPSPMRAMHHSFEKGVNGKVYDLMSWEFSSSGYAAVWAEENTRASIFEAMQRRETYATTGPRMTVRFWGGWNYQAADLSSRDLISLAYEKGVPMGGDLMSAPRGRVPSFVLVANREEGGANLDRIQVVKGWLAADGKTYEKVFNVSTSDQRSIIDNRVAPLVSTVKGAGYRNTIGAAHLSVVWTDPQFDPQQRAFYYARVLQIPTPRWTAYDQERFDLELPSDVPAQIQERAYTSPIWYRP